MTEWISVNDKLPNDGEHVLIYSRKSIYIKLYENNIFYDGDTYCYCPVGLIEEVSHWMPLPEPPND